jgi:hypothetical protein
MNGLFNTLTRLGHRLAIAQRNRNGVIKFRTFAHGANVVSI